MYCVKCGKKNTLGSSYCYNCGTLLVQPESEAPNSSPSPSEGATLHPPSSGPNPLPGNNPFGSPPAQTDPNWRPPFPYGYPPLPRRHQTQHFPVAPNGKPYVVVDHPEAFYAYKNKEKKQVYAPLATLRGRFYAALFDFMLVYLPLQFISLLLVLFANPDLQQKLVDTGTRLSQEQLSQEISGRVPPWVSLLIITLSFLYCSLLTWLAGGQTLGKKLTRIKVIRLDGAKMDFQTAFTRNLFGYSFGLGVVASLYGSVGSFVGLVLQVMVIVGFTASFTQALKRGWHDRLADTVVVGKTELVQGVNY